MTGKSWMTGRSWIVGRRCGRRELYDGKTWTVGGSLIVAEGYIVSCRANIDRLKVE